MYDKKSTLCAINFDNFFCHLGNKGQCGKLRLILHYFERLALDNTLLEGNLLFERKVVPQENLPTLDNWLSCEASLCDIQVHKTGRIEDAGPTTLQVDFANRKLGGGVLSTGRVQEEIRFSCCPELIAGQLFVEEMQDNEAVGIHGFRNYSRYSGYARDLAFNGPAIDNAKADCAGVLDNHLVCIDALPARRIGGAERQYQMQNVLRELNKALVGFSQDDGAGGREGRGGRKGSLSEIYRQYFSTLSEDIFHQALGEMLTSPDQDSPAMDPLPPPPPLAAAPSFDGEASLALGLGDLASHHARRRSSALSDVSTTSSCSTASSCSGSGSRRSSSFSSTSRRSSSRKCSSESSIELDEYFQSLAGRATKPSVIEEEELGHQAIQDFAEDLVAGLFQQGVAMAAGRRAGVGDIPAGGDTASRRASPRAGDIVAAASPNPGGEDMLPCFVQSGQPPAQATRPRLVRRAVGLVRQEELPSDDDLAIPGNDDPASRSNDPAGASSLGTASEAPVDRWTAERVASRMASQIMNDATEMALQKLRERSFQTKVEVYVGGLLDTVWGEVTTGIRQGRVRVVQVEEEESDVEDIDLDLVMFVDSFLCGVFQEAITSYQAEVQQEQRYLEAMWRREREKAALDARYFAAEFGGFAWGSSREIDTRKGSLNFVRGDLAARETQRRCSLDETGTRWRNRSGVTPGSSRRGSNNGFRDETLSTFEKQLVTSSPHIPSLVLFDGGDSRQRRRGSTDPDDPPNTDTDFLSLSVTSASSKTRASSIDSTSSREMLLDWLNQSQQSSSAATGTTTAGSAAVAASRHRTSSCHMDWFAHDLVLDAVDSAFVEMFGADYGVQLEQQQQPSLPSETHQPAEDTRMDSRVIHEARKQRSCDEKSDESQPYSTLPPQDPAHKRDSFKPQSGAMAQSQYYHHHDRGGTGSGHMPYDYPSGQSNAGQRHKQLTSDPTADCVRRRLPVVTGNWGCGAFRGDPHLKSLLQWCAASRAGAPVLVYYTCEEMEPGLGSVMERVCHLAASAGGAQTVGRLLTHVLRYCDERSLRSKQTTMTLYDFLLKSFSSSNSQS